jgi:hypothetical protein
MSRRRVELTKLAWLGLLVLTACTTTQAACATAQAAPVLSGRVMDEQGSGVEGAKVTVSMEPVVTTPPASRSCSNH